MLDNVLLMMCPVGGLEPTMSEGGADLVPGSIATQLQCASVSVLAQ